MLRTLTIIISVVIFTILAGVGSGLYIFWEFGRGLKDYKQLADYEPPIMTRVHAGDGRLLAEYAEQKRIFVPQDVMPRLVVQAFLSAEDKNFFYHPGVDPKNGSADPSSFGLTVYTGKGTENNTIRNVLENAVIFFTAALYSKLKEKPGVRNKKAKEQLEHDARGFEETALRWTYQYAR